MDKLSIFGSKSTEVSLASKSNNTVDTIVENLGDIRREQVLLRKGFEAMTWGEEVLDSEDVELEDIPEEQVNE